MLSVFMKYLIFGNMNRTFAVKMERSKMGDRDTKVQEQPVQLDDFSSSMSHGTVLCFAGRSRSNRLNYELPSNKSLA